MKFKIQHLIVSLILLAAMQAQAVEYFIHPEGGDIEHCNGLSSQPFSQNIENQNCALKHIF